MNPQPILVPVDFSDCSFGVLRQAASLARRLDAGLLLLHVWEPPDGVSPDTRVRPEPGGPEMTVQEYMERECRERLGVYLQTHDTVGVASEILTLRGPTAATIVEAARDRGAGMIVMGTHGRHGLAHALIGSVAEDVIRHASVPVMTIRSQHKPECEARSCAWCTSGVGPPELQLDAEMDG